jgi:hypothetical protein
MISGFSWGWPGGPGSRPSLHVRSAVVVALAQSSLDKTRARASVTWRRRSKTLFCVLPFLSFFPFGIHSGDSDSDSRIRHHHERERERSEGRSGPGPGLIHTAGTQTKSRLQVESKRKTTIFNFRIYSLCSSSHGNATGGFDIWHLAGRSRSWVRGDPWPLS